MIKATGYLFDKIAYISDCNYISKKVSKKLMNLDFLIIDCLRKNKHPSHFNYDDAIDFVKIVKPKKTILTNLHVDLDYFDLKKKLPKNIVPAFDSLSFNFQINFSIDLINFFDVGFVKEAKVSTTLPFLPMIIL